MLFAGFDLNQDSQLCTVHQTEVNAALKLALGIITPPFCSESIEHHGPIQDFFFAIVGMGNGMHKQCTCISARNVSPKISWEGGGGGGGGGKYVFQSLLVLLCII